jgi:ribose 5-phosphate isomerase A
MTESAAEAGKRAAAARALELVQPGMRLGLGTGTTAAVFVDLLLAKVREGLEVRCVATSQRTEDQAAQGGLVCTTLDELPQLDLTIDGADEFDPSLRLIKGGGGALLREKIVAAASARMVVITDASKAVSLLGRFPLPVEVNIFGLAATIRLVTAAAAACGCAGKMTVRKAPDGALFHTDGGHLILDCAFGAITDPERLSAALLSVPGVVEHGLFLGMASGIVCAGPSGIRLYGRLD